MGKIRFNASDLPVIQEKEGQTFVKQGAIQALRDLGVIPKSPSTIYSLKTKEDARRFKEFILKTELFHLIEKKGLKTIYIKPNLMTYIHPLGLNYTSILLLKALCELLRESPLKLKPVILESNMFYNSVFPKHTVQNVARKLGIDFAPVQNLSDQPTISREFGGRSYEIPKKFANSEQYFLINFPKLKAHPIFFFTCALKNLYGLFPEADKIYYFHHEQDIFDSVIAVNNLIRSDYTIVDAIKCQDKVHDLLTTALAKKNGGYYYDYQYLFASENPLAIDTLVKDLLGVDSDRVLDSLQSIYSNEYIIKGDQPPKLSGFKVSGYFKRLAWKRLTQLPFKQKFLHEQMRNVFKSYLRNPKYLFDQEIFQLE